MREPPPLMEPSGQRYGYLVRGAVMLLVGMVFETVTRPVVPWNYALGVLILSMGIGVGVAIFERYLPQWGPVPFLEVAAVVFFYTRDADMSVLPLFLFAGTCELARFGVRMQAPRS